jgi:hypothetical protein
MWLWLFFKMFFIQKYIKIYFLKKLFWTSAHQNDLKIPKNINFKKKNLIFFKNTFKILKQTDFLIQRNDMEIW